MSFNHEELFKKGFRPDGRGGWTKDRPKQLPDAIPERDAGPALVKPSPNEEGSRPRFGVRIVRFGTRLLDVDNLAGGCKPLVDQLRYCGLIPDDDPGAITLTFAQEQVQKKSEIRTEITIERIA